MTENLKLLPYTATSLSVIGRFIFMFLLYKNKSTNSLSLIFCILSIFSSSMWIYYSVFTNDLPMIIRSSTELTLITISSLYIIRNKLLIQVESSQQMNNPGEHINISLN
jgi:lipid-A-disaccharide synthase-like uncharacterized protein